MNKSFIEQPSWGDTKSPIKSAMRENEDGITESDIKKGIKQLLLNLVKSSLDVTRKVGKLH